MWLALFFLTTASLADGGVDEAPVAGLEAHPAVPVPREAAGDAGVAEPPSNVSLHGALEADLGLFPGGFGANGPDLLTTVHPVLGFAVGEVFGLELGPTFRLRVIDADADNRPSDLGGFLRGPDWDELSDFGQIVSSLRIGREGGPFAIRVGPMRKKTLGLGHLVWRYSNQVNPNYHPASAALDFRAGPVRGEFFASDVLGARLLAGEVSWDLGGTFSSDAAVKDRYVLALSVAHDFNLAGRPFNPVAGATPFTPQPATLLNLDASAVLVRNATLRWLVLLGSGARANAKGDLGFLVGTAVDATVKEVGFSTRFELRKQAGGFRQHFFGPMYELQRFVDVGYRGPSVQDALLPDGLSAFAELRVGIGTRVTFDVAAEYFFWNRLDLDGSFSLALLNDWLYFTLRSTMLGLAQAPRYAFSGGLRLRLFASFYLLAEGATVFLPQPDGSLIRGVGGSAGVGIDFER